MAQDIFEQYYPYVDRAVVTDKELLRKRFEAFLDNPEMHGCFVVRWKENETHYNNEDVWQHIESCR